MPKKILLVDISHLFFRAFYAFPSNLINSKNEPINAIFGVAQMLFSAIEKEKPDFVFGAKDLASKTLRSEEFAEYKGHRPELDDNLRRQIPEIFKFFDAFSVPVFFKEGYEADDMLASLAEKFRGNADFEIEILTGDADALQLIGENVSVLRPSKGENDKWNTEKLYEKKGLFPLQIPDFKGLSGDSSDNLKGVEGIGEKTATNLLQQFSSLEKIFEALDEQKLSGAVAKKLENGREIAFFTRKLATLHRDLEMENFVLEHGKCGNFEHEKILSFFQDLGSNALQKRLISLFPHVKNAENGDDRENENKTQTQKVHHESEQIGMF